MHVYKEIVTLQLEDCDYISLDPKMIRLPAPIPPSDRLLAAVEAFYGPPSHERPRDVYVITCMRTPNIFPQMLDTRAVMQTAYRLITTSTSRKISMDNVEHE